MRITVSTALHGLEGCSELRFFFLWNKFKIASAKELASSDASEMTAKMHAPDDQRAVIKRSCFRVLTVLAAFKSACSSTPAWPVR